MAREGKSPANLRMSSDLVWGSDVDPNFVSVQGSIIVTLPPRVGSSCYQAAINFCNILSLYDEYSRPLHWEFRFLKAWAPLCESWHQTQVQRSFIACLGSTSNLPLHSEDCLCKSYHKTFPISPAPNLAQCKQNKHMPIPSQVTMRKPDKTRKPDRKPKGAELKGCRLNWESKKTT